MKCRSAPWARYALPAVLAALPPLAHAAPHILGGPEHPATGVAIPWQQRLGGMTGVRAAADWSAPATLRLLFLRVDFPPDDDPTTTGSGEWGDCIALCNNDPDYWINKNAADLAAYYQEVSGGRLTLDITISTGVYRLPQPMASYGYPGGISQINTFFRDSLQAADADIDFSAYDTVLVVHAGSGEETDIAWDTPGDLWSLYYSGLNVAVDGITVSEAIVMPQTGTQDRDDAGDLIVIDPLGVYAHEFGHWLGLPDLYSTAWIQTWKGIGRWGLMGDGLYNRRTADAPRGSGPAHPEAWSRLDLGWAQADTIPPTPDPQGLYSLAPVQSGERVVQLPAGPDTARYYLLENRPQTGFDQGLPGGGLLVWLVDPEVIAAQRPYNAVNNSVYLPGVKLIEADGDNALLAPYDDPEQGDDLGSAGDPFPGSGVNTAFTPHTTPGSSTFGRPGWLYLRDIAAAGAQFEFRLGFAPPVPQGLALETAGDRALRLDWDPVAALDLDHYRIYRNEQLWQQTTAPTVTDRLASACMAYRVSAVDINGHESPRSAPAGNTAPLPSCDGNSDCFIAALAANSAYAPELRHLRAFRDRHMRKTPLGRWLVRGYYALSPAIAAPLRRHPALRHALRPLLRPLLAGARWLMRR